MSEETKGAVKKDRTSREKDKRMEHLEEEIARLEHRSEILKRERIEYEDKFQRAVLRSVNAYNAEPLKTLKHSLETREEGSVAGVSLDENPEDALTPETVENRIDRGKALPAGYKTKKARNAKKK